MPFCLISEIIYRGLIISILTKKRHGIFFFFYMPPTPKKFGNIKASKTQHFSVKTKVFFVKTEQQHLTIFHSKSFYIIFVDILCEIINP